MKRVLLVSPLRNYSMAGSLGNEMYPSGALLLLGTLLREQGHEVKVVHMVADKMDIPGFDDLLRDFRPDIVGFTVSTYQTKITRVLLRKTKEYNREVITVAGGAHATALGAQFLHDFPHTDIVVHGEGEYTMSFIAKEIPWKHISGIHYRDGNEIISTAPPALLSIDALNDLPRPDKSLINFKRFVGLFPVGRRPSMFIMSSRGCPYQCIFCSKSIYGNTLRLRSPESIMAEVEHLYRNWGVREIHFGDDTFNANLDWAHRLLDLIITRGYHKKLIFRVALRVNKKILDLDLLYHMKAAGVWFIMFGVENGNQDMLNHMRKGITVEEVKRAFTLARSVGIKTEAFFIIGMPGETVQTIQDSYELYQEIKPFWGGFARAMPLPGTAFTTEVVASGHLLCEDYDEYGPSCKAVRTDTLSADDIDMWMAKMDRMTRWDKMSHPKQLMYAVKDKVLMRLLGGRK